MYDEGLSIVIPVYNSAKTIEQCLRSICDQTYTNLQIICVNDGSNDNSLNILNECKKNDPRIEVYTQDNSGSSAARNTGIRYATKRYITFVDSDDEIVSWMYETMLDYLVDNQLDCVACEMLEQSLNKTASYLSIGIAQDIVKGKNDILEYIVKPLIGFNKRDVDCLPSMVNKVFCTHIIKENNLIMNTSRTYGEDWEFCIHYFSFINSIGFVHEPLYHYIHWTNGSLITRVQENYLEMELDANAKFRKWFPSLNWYSMRQKKLLLYLPVKAAEYYRKNLSGDLIQSKIDSFYDTCITDKNYYKYAYCDKAWKKRISDKKLFDSYIWKASTKATLIYKCKKKLKMLLKR